MKKINWSKVILITLGVLILFFGGFACGVKSFESKKPLTTVVDHYIQLPPIHDTVRVDKPIRVIVPPDTAKIIEQCVKDGIYAELFPEKVIEKEIYLTSEDTLAIVYDWATVRHYQETILDNDTIGTITVMGDVQYNRLRALEYELKLLQKQTEIETVIKRKYEPFLGATVFTDSRIQGEVGTFINGHLGASINYTRDLANDKNAFGIGLRIKF